MKNPLRNAAIAILQFAIGRIDEKGRLNLPLAWRTKHLDYPVPKHHMTRIFQMHSSRYSDEPTMKGIEIRTLAGYGEAGAHDYEHGFGLTRVMHNGGQMSLYTSDLKFGLGLGPVKMLRYCADVMKNVPAVIMRARTLNSILGKAASIEDAPYRCQQAIVARHSIMKSPAKQVIFTIQADYTSREKDENVTLKEIFMPVVDPAGKVAGLRRIDPKDDDADIQTLRALIFFKIVSDHMAERQYVDIAGCLAAVNALPLDKKSTLKDYLTFRVEPMALAA